MTARFRLRCGITLLLAATGAQAYARQDPETTREQSRLEGELKRYHAVVDAYREGSDESVDAILAWDPQRLTKIVAAAQTPLDIHRPWHEERVKAAAMLHTDAAIRVLDDEPRLSFQLGLITRLLHMAGEQIRPFARSWYVAITRVLRDRTLLFVAEGLLDQGRTQLPGDAVILYESGILQEQLATFSALIIETVTEVPLPRGYGGGVQSDTSRFPADRRVIEHRRTLEKAAQWLRESIRADPSNELAQLHLGRVQVLRGNHDEGVRMLEPLAASAADPETSYLATMFLGAMHQRRGRDGEAEQTYRKAIGKLPAAQSAYVALSEVLQKLGRGDDSRDVLMALLRTPATNRTEPWWWYLADPVQVASSRMDALRASVRK